MIHTQSVTERPRRLDRDVDGIVLLDKPQGLSSNAALQQARRILCARKAGHAGSLDPLATGMLPLCFGEATKVCGNLLDASKTYIFTARLGQKTDSGDADGLVIEEQPVPILTESAIAAVLTRNIGELQQIPPMYSALKHNGERLYAKARRGEVVERSPRAITIASLSLLAWRTNELQIQVRCSKGTYVRTLAEDLAAQLGTIAHLTALRRTEVEPFSGREMITLEDLAAWAETGESAPSPLIPADQALTHWPAVVLNAAQTSILLHGQALDATTELSPMTLVRLYSDTGRFLGIGERRVDGRIHPKRLVANLPNPPKPAS